MTDPEQPLLAGQQQATHQDADEELVSCGGDALSKEQRGVVVTKVCVVVPTHIFSACWGLHRQ